jgi:hypothetical protein
MQVTPVQSLGAMMSAARTVLICGGSFLWYRVSNDERSASGSMGVPPASGIDRHAACGMNRSPPACGMDRSPSANGMDMSH